MQKSPSKSIEVACLTTHLATVLIARSDKGVCSILLGDTAESLYTDLQQRFPNAKLVESNHALAPLLKKVAEFLAKPQAGLDFPLDIQGSDFQKSVWAILQSIPVGQTLSYSEVAKRLNKPKAARAIASACAANPLALVIPCHRVVRADGGLSGYRWGIERKRQLLAQEQHTALTSAQG